MKDKFYIKLGITLQDYRNKANLTQEEMAFRLGLRQTAVSNYEKGIRKIPVDILKKYCDIIGISLQELIDRL